MRARTDDRPTLLRVSAWGEISVAESGRGRDGAIVEELFIERDDLSAALDLGVRQQQTTWPAVPGPVSLSKVEQGPARAGALRIERAAPRGSTVNELISAHGPLSEEMIAALCLDLMAAIRGWHRQQLVLGLIDPALLIVCPPGSDGLPGLLAFDAGLPSLIQEVSGALNGWQSPRFQSLFETVEVVAPEVASGAAPSISSDTYALCALLSYLLLGRHVFEGETPAVVLHRASQGPNAETAEELRGRAPTLGALILQGMSPSPWLRRGIEGELLKEIGGLLGARQVASLSVSAGGGPWTMGSPLIPLAAYTSTTAWADRGRRAPPQKNNPQGAPRSLPSTEKKSRTPSSTEGGSPAQQAKLHAALSKLDAKHTMASQSPATLKINVAKLVVLLLTLAVCAAIVFVGMKRTRSLRRVGTTEPATPQEMTPPMLPKAGPLFDNASTPR